MPQSPARSLAWQRTYAYYGRLLSHLRAAVEGEADRLLSSVPDHPVQAAARN